MAKISKMKNSFSKNAFLYMILKFWIEKSTSNKQAGKGSGSSIILQIDEIQGIVFSSKDTIEPVTFAHLEALRSQKVGTRG